MTRRPKITPARRAEIAALQAQIFIVRGMQVFIIGLGAALGIFDDRGWPAFIVGCMLALVFQTLLPVLPPWIESLRPGNDDAD